MADKSGVRDRVAKYREQCAKIGQRIEKRHITRLNKYANDPDGCLGRSNANKYHVKPGTQIIKKYRDREYVVLVAASDLFVCDGQNYKTLSAVARHITNNKVSGYEFFGFNNKKAK